jgi:formamidopyrimidine-DNA glycosylase
MPELPEVETITRDLKSNLLGKKLLKLVIVDKKIPLKEKDFFKFKNLKILEIKRLAKMIIFVFSDNLYLIFHLKMTGQLVLKTSKNIFSGGHPIKNISTLPNKFTRVIFTFDNNQELFFNDVRRFGWIKIFNKKEFEEIFNKNG